MTTHSGRGHPRAFGRTPKNISSTLSLPITRTSSCIVQYIKISMVRLIRRVRRTLDDRSVMVTTTMPLSASWLTVVPQFGIHVDHQWHYRSPVAYSTRLKVIIEPSGFMINSWF